MNILSVPISIIKATPS